MKNISTSVNTYNSNGIFTCLSVPNWQIFQGPKLVPLEKVTICSPQVVSQVKQKIIIRIHLPSISICIYNICVFLIPQNHLWRVCWISLCVFEFPLYTYYEELQYDYSLVICVALILIDVLYIYYCYSCKHKICSLQTNAFKCKM